MQYFHTARLRVEHHNFTIRKAYEKLAVCEKWRRVNLVFIKFFRIMKFSGFGIYAD